MPEKQTIRRAQRDKRQGKAASTQAGEFVREEMHHIREGKHGAKSRKQAIAIGLSKARRAGVDLPSPPEDATPRTKRSAARAKAKGGDGKSIHDYGTNPKRSRAVRGALKRMGKPKLRGAGARASARKAARTRARRGTGTRGKRQRKKK